ncbi:uncharacterized protein BP5553_01801 [Venustampulla echinocandica]|uniref:Seipin n=1 Tax=Venustampulla echinocandica TaxID=2656787 RepID=A0A370U215_9HELO|nr:uncharacterized protein BP5553_01801 [Venustampulla echinocandica]RDL41822.1 hypothetical protein BP5553_01801 [Venustampulla echinocandica]
MFIPGYSSAVPRVDANVKHVDVIPGARGSSTSSSSNAKRQQHQDSEAPRRRQSLPARCGHGNAAKAKMITLLFQTAAANPFPIPGPDPGTLAGRDIEASTENIPQHATLPDKLDIPASPSDRDGPHPYGIACLDSELISQQAYDISITLRVPRSPPNLDTGNFMLSLNLLSQSYKPSLFPITPPPSSTNPPPTHLISTPSLSIPPETVLHSSRRPTILPYASPLISLSSRILSLPLYILNLRQESESLTIPMAERLSFPGRSTKLVPRYAFLEVQAGQHIQVYSVQINFTARFSGLRWVMYNHRIASLIIFTSAFWVVEVVFALLGWMGFRMLFSSTEPPSSLSSKSKAQIKKERGIEDEDTETIKTEPATEDEPDLSDTPRSFPTYGRQPPLRYEPRIKDEERDNDEDIIEGAAIQPLDADDEDEHILGGMRGRERRGVGEDSGLGTSFSEGGARSGAARRRSGGFGRGV